MPETKTIRVLPSTHRKLKLLAAALGENINPLADLMLAKAVEAAMKENKIAVGKP